MAANRGGYFIKVGIDCGTVSLRIVELVLIFHQTWSGY